MDVREILATDGLWFSERETMTEAGRRIARAHGLTLADLKGVRRSKKYVLPRQAFATYAVRKLGCSQPQVGAFINRDHTTILHALRAHEARVAKGLVNDDGTPRL